MKAEHWKERRAQYLLEKWEAQGRLDNVIVMPLSARETRESERESDPTEDREPGPSVA